MGWSTSLEAKTTQQRKQQKWYKIIVFIVSIFVVDKRQGLQQKKKYIRQVFRVDLAAVPDQRLFTKGRVRKNSNLWFMLFRLVLP